MFSLPALAVLVLAGTAAPVLSMPAGEFNTPEYNELMAREPIFLGVGPVRLNTQYHPLDLTAREDELAARGIFSLFKDGLKVFDAAKDSSDKKKKDKKGKREFFESDLVARDNEELMARGIFSLLKDGFEAFDAVKGSSDKKKEKNKREFQDELLARDIESGLLVRGDDELMARSIFSLIDDGFKVFSALDKSKDDKKKNKRDFETELLAREDKLMARSIFSLIGDGVKVFSDLDKAKNSNDDKKKKNKRELVATELLVRQMPTDELMARGLFSLFSDGLKVFDAIDDSKKNKKNNRRQLELEWY